MENNINAVMSNCILKLVIFVESVSRNFVSEIITELRVIKSIVLQYVRRNNYVRSQYTNNEKLFTSKKLKKQHL